MKFTWLCQAGLLFETGNVKIMIDPYLSDSVKKVNPEMVRRIPADKRYLNIKPDVLIITHDHLDHADPDTLPHILRNGGTLVLAPKSVWEHIRKINPNNNCVIFNRGTTVTYNGISFRAVKAEHTDESAIGVMFQAEGKKIYVTGDTLYNEEIFKDTGCDTDTVFLPVNGYGCNMNMTDALAFAKRCGAKTAVPVHWGLYDTINPEQFGFIHKIIPVPYKEMTL